MNINKNIAVSDSGFVFNPTTGESYTVNPIGVEIIEMLKQEKSINEINQVLIGRYNADIVTIDKDVSDFINLLKLYSLIENQNAA
ncbi:MAG: PqqD family protein [Bacteroidetes bacterium]|nr:PqqD family protein [Bacteroidota bacterium]MBL6944633.1 PqqD family protein [Bacteroidales bacterium]